VRRRTFIAAAAGTLAWPLIARAQQPLPLVGFLRSSPATPFEHLVAAFRLGLKEAGFIEGQNVAIAYRNADNQLDRLPTLVADLIRAPTAVIVGDSVAAIAAKTAGTVPVIFVTGGDPVAQGVVASLNRPDGHVTGISFSVGTFGAKRLELLQQLVAKPTMIAMLVNAGSLTAEAERQDVLAAARSIGQPLTIIEIRSDGDIEEAVTRLAQEKVGALLVGAGPLLSSHRERLAAEAQRQALPSSFPWREAVQAGGLTSYGPSVTDAYREAGVYAGRILKGERPGDMPVLQSARFEFLLNLKTARALGLTVPDKLLALADEVIE
jgi:putative tryptophan/tyrosine transport system substrate-binding protein